MTATGTEFTPQSLQPEELPAPAPRRQRRGHYWFPLMGLLAVGGLGAAAWSFSKARERSETEQAAALQSGLARGPHVLTAKVIELPPGRTITLTGEVSAIRQSTLYAKISGYLRTVKVDRGDRVHKGDVLGYIESPEVEQQVVSKEADLAIKKLTDARYRTLAKEGLISQEERDRAEADVRIASSDLLGLRAMRGYEVIRAPFDGVVTARHADPGALLQSASSNQAALPLVDIADLERVKVRVYLAQAEALAVRVGDPVTVWTDEFPDRKVEAKVTRFSHQLELRSRTMLTEVELDNHLQVFLPGTYVRVSLKLDTPKSLAVAADAVVFRNGKAAVARVRDDKVGFVTVDIGSTDGQLVRVFSGIEAGDLVVLHPGDEVMEGSPVQVHSTEGDRK